MTNVSSGESNRSSLILNCTITNSANDLVFEGICTGLTIFSILSNIITIWVIFPERKKNSPNFLMLVLAFVDTVCPILYFLYYNLRLTCSWFNLLYLVVVAKAFETYIIVLISVDRFIAIKFPLKSGIQCSVVRIKIVLVITLVLLFISKIPFIYKVEHYETYVDNVVTYYIPMVLLVILNFILVLKLSKRSKSSLSTGVGIDAKQYKQNHRQNRHRNVNITLISIVILFIILETPVTIYITFDGSTEFYKFSLICLLINFSINIFVYGLIGKKFRQLLKKRVQNMCSRNKKSVQLTNQTLTMVIDSTSLSHRSESSYPEKNSI